MKLLGIRIDRVTLEESQKKVRGFLTSSGQFKVFTPNPEMLVKAQKDEYFREVLNSGDLNICDGFGVWLVVKMRQWVNDDCCAMDVGLQRIAGVDFMLEICKIAEKTGKSIYLLGSNSNDVAKKAVENLQKQFPKLTITGFDNGPTILEDDKGIVCDNDSQIEEINRVRPDILFVAFGMGKQEKWIHEYLSKMLSVKITMGVGGAFDYLSGNVKRAPCWMRKIGLEWMYRLFQQPQRFGRIFNATFKFIFLALIQK